MIKHQDERGESDPDPQPTSGRAGMLGLLAGIVIGTAAGMIGVGGGEFRIPVLIHVLRLPVRVAAGANLLIGLAVVILGVIRRWGYHEWNHAELLLAGVMAIASLAGATVGALAAHRLPLKPLKFFVCGYLLLVGSWMVIESLTHSEVVLLNPGGMTRLVMGALTGFLIAGISGALGVAGGELRIPALIYLFGLPVKQAGTVSLLVSIPTVASGALAYRGLGHVPNSIMRISALMGLGSVLGVMIGAALLPYVDKHVLKGILGAILLVATVCLTLPWLRQGPNQEDEGSIEPGRRIEKA